MCNKFTFFTSTSFVHLTELYVLNSSYMADTSLMVIPPNQVLCRVYDIRQLIHMIQWCKFAPSFYSPLQNYIYPQTKNKTLEKIIE